MSITDVRKQTAELMGDVGPLPCSVCADPTPRATLSQFGARCERCYADYLRNPPPRPIATAALPRKRELYP